MKKIKFAILGTGWRAEFFMRIALAASEQFTLTGVMSRDAEKARALHERMGVPVVTTMDDLLAAKPDFVVLCVARVVTVDYMEALIKRGVPVLCETPAAMDKESLYHLWKVYQEHPAAKVQIAEQYHLQPYYAAWINALERGMIGAPSNMTMSIIHGYHAVSIFRQMLRTGMGKVTVSGKRYRFPLQPTDSRTGIVKNGVVEDVPRDVITFQFENGTIGFYDFSGSQYHSFIRTRHLNVQGAHGEIDNDTIRYVNTAGDAIASTLSRIDRGIRDLPALSHMNISLNGEVMYENPFMYKRFNDDEIAVAATLTGMANYLETGVDMYSFADGMQDTIVWFAMEEAVKTGETITVERQPWSDATAQ